MYKELVKAKNGKGIAGSVAWNFQRLAILPSEKMQRFRPQQKNEAEEFVAQSGKNLPC